MAEMALFAPARKVQRRMQCVATRIFQQHIPFAEGGGAIFSLLYQLIQESIRFGRFQQRISAGVGQPRLDLRG